jgi:hypothetical protein
MAIRSEVHQRLEERVHAGVRRLSGKGKLRGLFLPPEKFATATTYSPFRSSENRNSTPADFSVENPCQVSGPNSVGNGLVIDALILSSSGEPRAATVSTEVAVSDLILAIRKSSGSKG